MADPRIAAAYPGLLPSVSVVIAAHSLQRWDDLCGAVASVASQTVPTRETVVVIDHNRELLARATTFLHGAIVVPNVASRGASGARNSGVAASAGEVVAFLDDDATAAPGWLAALLPHFADPDIVGVGGRVQPRWDHRRPAWLPPEFDWTIGVSYRGMPTHSCPVRNVWTNNMAIRRQVFDTIGGFRETFGKVGSRPRPEDTDLCLRARTSGADATWMYEPLALTSHRVPRHRARLRYFLSRCFSEGVGKAQLAALNGAGEAMRTERGYARRMLPRGMAQGMAETVHGDLAGVARSLAITAGLSFAAAGFLAGRVGDVRALAGVAGGPAALAAGPPVVLAKQQVTSREAR